MGLGFVDVDVALVVIVLVVETLTYNVEVEASVFLFFDFLTGSLGWESKEIPRLISQSRERNRAVLTTSPLFRLFVICPCITKGGNSPSAVMSCMIS